MAPVPACWLFKASATTFDLLTLKLVSESRVTWAATFVLILVFLGLSVLELGPMYATDVRRQTKASLNAFTLWGRRHIRRVTTRRKQRSTIAKV